MGIERGNIPEENCGSHSGEYFSERNLEIPEGIRWHISQIRAESSEDQIRLKQEIVENFLRTSIDIQSVSEILDNLIYDEIFAIVFSGIVESRYTLEDIEFPDYVLRDICINALGRFSQEHPMQYREFYEDGNYTIIFGGVSIDVSAVLPDVPTIIRPQARPNWSLEDIYERRLEAETSENQFEKLQEEGFSTEIINFIRHDLFPKICGDEYECTEQSIENIRLLCLFVMDIETTAGQNLNNTNSSASGYFHFLNQNGRNTDLVGNIENIVNDAGEVIGTRNVPDGIPDWNTIDTTLRHATNRFYNNDREDLNIWQRYEVDRINLETDPEARWVERLWERNDNNGEGRAGEEYLFDDQVRLFLARAAITAPNSFRNILLGQDLRESAENIYRQHHGRVTHGSRTERRMQEMLDKHYA